MYSCRHIYIFKSFFDIFCEKATFKQLLIDIIKIIMCRTMLFFGGRALKVWFIDMINDVERL